MILTREDDLDLENTRLRRENARLRELVAAMERISRMMTVRGVEEQAERGRVGCGYLPSEGES